MPENSKLVAHTAAVNLARRWSVQNENDLMQEDMSDNTMDLPKYEYNHEGCSKIASHMTSLKSMPMECMKFADIASEVKRRDTDTTHPTQFLS